MNKRVFSLRNIALALVGGLVAAAIACSGGSAPDQPRVDSAAPGEELTVLCAVTEAFAAVPMLVARGVDAVPSAFDAINHAWCEFSSPIASVTLTLSRGGPVSLTHEVSIDSPSSTVAFPIVEHEVGVLPAGLTAGGYDRVIEATDDGGASVTVLSDSQAIWVVDPATTTIEGARGALTASRTALAESLSIPLGEPTLTALEPVEWGDASLGCPELGMAYAQVITPGFRLVFEHQSAGHELHTNQDGSIVVRCEAG